jgi:hypothetical protein
MRHFLQGTEAITRLAIGVIVPARLGALMAGSGSTLGLQACLFGAAGGAVDLAVLAAAADQGDLATASTAI